MDLTPTPNSNVPRAPSGKRQSHKQPKRQISVGLSPELIKQVDQAAAQEYTTRSDIIRTAVLWYLRPQGPELDKTDPEAILEVLKRRKLKAVSKDWLRNNSSER